MSRFDYQNKDNDIDRITSVVTKDSLLAGELIIHKTLKSLEYTWKDEEDGNVKNDTVLYFTERNFSGVKKIKINQFIQDIDKALDSMKKF